MPAGPSTTSSPLLPQAAPVELPPPPVARPSRAAALPLDWLVARELLDTPAAPQAWEPTPEPAQPPPRRRRGDDAEVPPVPAAEARTTERPSPTPRTRIEDRGGYRVAMPEVPPAAAAPAPPTGRRPPRPPAPGAGWPRSWPRTGWSPATGGRRRRRYRDDDESDDVLSRVLGRDEASGRASPTRRRGRASGR